MKKRFLSLLALGTAMLLTSCGNNPTSTPNPSTPTPNTSTPAPSTPAPSTPAPSTPAGTGLKDKWNAISIAEAKTIAATAGETTTTERYYIYGVVSSITNANYGAMVINDGTDSISAYGTYSADGSIGYSAMSEKPVAGDEVVLYSTLHTFKGEAEIQNGRIVEFIHNEPVIDPSEYKAMSIKEARAADTGNYLQIEGVVSRITFANGIIPNGFFLVDDGASIYVFDSQIAAQVSIGNKVTIAGKKDRWILETEQTNAAKYGYKGSNQITDCILVANDKNTNDFDKSWITETTVKGLMDTPVTEDITGLIYKTNALVRKVPGDGFINYYLNDLDGTTGSYVYTQCNGNDFAWLDAFDGKICTVYMTAINAKSSASGCVWRFVPISVSNDNYAFDKTKTTQFVYDYYIAEQFASVYTGDPVLEVTTNVDSELLGFTGAKITYSSNNTDSVSFVEENGKLIMHAKSSGTAEITIKVNYDTYPVLEKKINITVKNPDDIKSITVKQAIDTAPNTEVVVRGIAGPSLVNRKGIYIIDESGAIAITMSETDLATISYGNEIIIKATRSQFNLEENKYPGQSVLLDATIEANLYGKHDYSTASFISGKTVTELVGTDIQVDDTAQVYVVEAKITKNASAYATTYMLNDDTSSMTLYAANGNQYAWLEPYLNQTVTVEVALCNWNKKDPYKGCVLAVRDGANKVINLLNYNN